MKKVFQLFISLILILLISGCSTLRMINIWRYEYSDPSEAVLRLSQIAESDPDSPSAPMALLYIGDLYYGKLNQKDKAVEAYHKVIKDYPDTKEAITASQRLAHHYFVTKEYKKSQAIAHRLFNENPSSKVGTEAQWSLSQSYENMRDYRHSASSYYAFALLNPKDERAINALLKAGEIYKDKLNRENKAIDIYRLLVKVYGRNNSKEVWMAVRELKAMRVDVPSPNERDDYNKPVRMERKDKFAEMVKNHELSSAKLSIFDRVDTDAIFRATMSAAPGGGLGGDQPGDSNVDPKNVMLTLANTYYVSMDYLKAGAFYYQLELRNSDDPKVYWYLGDCYAKLGLSDKANEYHKRSMNMSAEMFEWAIKRAENEYSTQDYLEALDILEQLIPISPSHKISKIYYDMGLAYRKINDIDMALESFERSFAFDPTINNKDSAQHIAEILNYNKSDPLRAYIYQDIVEDKTRSFKVQSEIANICYKYESYKWARLKYKSSAELAPDQETALSMLVQSAIATSKAGNYSIAKTELLQLLESNKDNEMIINALAEIERLKDIDCN